MAEDLWSSFAHDPRQSANAGLRASDHDREQVAAVLTSAFADGRIEREELDERLSATAAARTLGELPPLLADLVPLRTVVPRSSRSLVTLSSTDLQERAEEEWRDRRNAAVWGLVGSGLVCWAIWFATGHDYFPWPVLINVFAFLNVVRTVTERDRIVRQELRRLEKKQARRQRWPKGLA